MKKVIFFLKVVRVQKNGSRRRAAFALCKLEILRRSKWRVSVLFLVFFFSQFLLQPFPPFCSSYKKKVLAGMENYLLSISCLSNRNFFSSLFFFFDPSKSILISVFVKQEFLILVHTSTTTFKPMKKGKKNIIINVLLVVCLSFYRRLQCFINA